MISFVLALAIAPYAIVPAEERPAFVKSAIEAVAAKDASRITGSFEEIVEVTDNGSRSIAAEQAVQMLSVCSQTEVRSLHDNVFVIKFECPSRRLVAKGCDSGDLTLIVDGDRSSFAISNARKISDSCRPFAPPPPPPPVDEALAVKFAQALVNGDDVVLSALVSDDTLVSTVRKFPGTRNQNAEGNSKGLTELRRQYASIVAQVGQPTSVSCEKQQLFEMCKFNFAEGGKVLLAFLNTKGSGMYLINFIYATRA